MMKAHEENSRRGLGLRAGVLVPVTSEVVWSDHADDNARTPLRST